MSRSLSNLLSLCNWSPLNDHSTRIQCQLTDRQLRACALPARRLGDTSTSCSACATYLSSIYYWFFRIFQWIYFSQKCSFLTCVNHKLWYIVYKSTIFNRTSGLAPSRGVIPQAPEQWNIAIKKNSRPEYLNFLNGPTEQRGAHCCSSECLVRNKCALIIIINVVMMMDTSMDGYSNTYEKRRIESSFFVFFFFFIHLCYVRCRPAMFAEV